MAEYVRIVRSCAAYWGPNLESPQLFELEVGTLAELLRDEDRLFFKAAYGGRPVFIPKECAALTDEAPKGDSYAKQPTIAKEGPPGRQPEGMYCEKCGSAIKRDVRFCPKCGEAVASAP